MPFPNEHASRQEDPSKYKSFRRENNKFGPGIDVIWGILPDGKTELQTIRFAADKYTPEEAKKWLKEHNMKETVEPAAEEHKMSHDDFLLQSISASTTCVDKDKKLYRKELIRVGKYIKASNGQVFEVKPATLAHWKETFASYTGAGNKVPLPITHDLSGNPENNRGWMVGVEEDGTSLYGILELSDDSLATVSDVSIYSPAEYTDGLGNVYNYAITHVALCSNPLVPGLGPFESIAASMNIIKESPMDWSKISAALKLEGLTDENASDLICAAFTAATKPAETITASAAEPPKVDSRLIEATAKIRTIELDKLVVACSITTAVRNRLAERYTKTDGLSLSLSSGVDDGFDELCSILANNSVVELKQKTHVQVAVLPDVHNDVSPIVADAERRAAKSK